MKRKIGLYLLLGGILSLAFIKKDDRQINVVIDAGHGGKDHGATHDGFSEKDIVDAITAKIKSQNKNAEVLLHYTRSGDEFVTLNDRAARINEVKPDLVLSLHVTSNANTAASGFEVFVTKEGEQKGKSLELAEKLSEKFKQNHGFKLRGVKEAPFYILKNSQAPAMVVELGFLSNSEDRKILTDDAQQTAIANTILEFVGELN